MNLGEDYDLYLNLDPNQHLYFDSNHNLNLNFIIMLDLTNLLLGIAIDLLIANSKKLVERANNGTSHKNKHEFCHANFIGKNTRSCYRKSESKQRTTFAIMAHLR